VHDPANMCCCFNGPTRQFSSVLLYVAPCVDPSKHLQLPVKPFYAPVVTRGSQCSVPASTCKQESCATRAVTAGAFTDLQRAADLLRPRPSLAPVLRCAGALPRSSRPAFAPCRWLSAARTLGVTRCDPFCPSSLFTVGPCGPSLPGLGRL
jgi:hypothetical protein